MLTALRYANTCTLIGFQGEISDLQSKEEGLNKKLKQLQTQLEHYKNEKERIGNICDELDEENQNLERDVKKLKAEIENHGKLSCR